MIGQPGYKSFDELGDVKKVLEQFVGKTIGTPPKGSIHDVIIKDLIGKLGLSIDVKNYAWADFVLGAMTDKEIEGAVGTPPLAVASRRFAGTKTMIPPHKLWPNNPSYGIVVRNEFMQHRGDHLEIPGAARESFEPDQGRASQGGGDRLEAHADRGPGVRRRSVSRYRRSIALLYQKNTSDRRWALSRY